MDCVIGGSLVLVNTNKGVTLFYTIKESINYMDVCIKDVMQPNLKDPSVSSEKYKYFTKDYIERGFPFVAKKYSDTSFVYKVKHQVYAT